ncbi:putative PAB1 binding protein (Pbp1) [Aspergillus lucknowensis]|uniref:LsmAD domain-containing protein n=1 Tax=Aspergillus lucknowensis TaxID=176173 RepID=A0ABR4M6B4_9EURO
MPQKSSSSPRPFLKESNTPDNHAHDRLLFLFASFIGLTTTITTRNGDEFSGIFSSSSLEPSDSSITLKMAQRQSKQDQHRSNGVSDATSPFLGSAPEHSVTFNVNDVVGISVPNVTTTDVLAKPNGAAIGFRTDADISGNLAMRERTLKRWEPGTDANTDMSLESTSTATTGWDQFETNARLFGATSSYDENIYTTRINRSDPTYKQKEAEAARIAREIENSEVENAHIREERGLLGADVGDEEDKYSGVRRDEKNFPPLASGQLNKYTPPALRNQLTATAPSYTGSVKRTTSTKEASPTPVAAKEPALTQPHATPASADGPSPNLEQKAVPPKASSAAPAATKGALPENNYEHEVLDRFRIFATNEKLKFQERRRNQASHDRSIKINELMKFSQNFKLATPVPKDLVPILAKDPHKQEEIIQRAQQQAEEKKDPKSAATIEPVDHKRTTDPSQPAARRDSGAAASQPQQDRPNYPRGRQMFPPTGPQGGPGGRGPHQPLHSGGRQATGMLGHRLADNFQQRKGTAAGSVPAPLPIHEPRAPPLSTDQSNISSPTKIVSPTSSVSTKFNVRAMEFKPNPAASTFTPGASNPSVFARGQSDSRAKSPSAFFGAKKLRPISERPSLKDQFNPIKRMKKESAEQTERNYTSNGGIPFAYNTPPTWNVAANGDEEKTYAHMFKYPSSLSATSPQSRSASNPQVPHGPQMPFQFQQTPNMPSTSGPPHGPHLHPQQHHGSGPTHFEDSHRMQISASTSQMFPSPRLQHGYPSPMAPHAQLAFGQQPMPQFYVGQGGPQPAHMRHYQGGPQFVNPQTGMAAPMMVQQPSGGPYMGVPQGVGPFTPQMQMYSPNPAHTYPHVPPPQPHSGYPSPNRPAPMMVHQNSQSGQPPQHVMYMSPGQHQQPMYAGQQSGHMPPARGNYPPQQPHFQSSPHQAHHYPPHQHRTPSSGFNQLPQMPPQMAAQAPPAANPGVQAQEPSDESK